MKHNTLKSATLALLPAAMFAINACSTGPITITNFLKFGWLREQLQKDGIKIGIPGQ